MEWIVSRVSFYILLFLELEINIKFPTCWDGVNLEPRNGKPHVVYSQGCAEDLPNECFDGDCPASHPVKLPELHLYVRALEYEGGAHVFADGTDVSRESYYVVRHLIFLRCSTVTISQAGMRMSFNMFWTTVTMILMLLILMHSAVIG